MKRFFMIFLASLMAVTLAACGGEAQPSQAGGDPSPAGPEASQTEEQAEDGREPSSSSAADAPSGTPDGEAEISQVESEEEAAVEGPETLTVDEVEMPAHVKAYSLDTAYDPDPLSGIIQMEGITYQMPVPFIVLKENGWDYAAHTSDSVRYYAVPPGKSNIRMTLVKGDMRLEVEMTNYDTQYMPNEYCYIHSIFFDSDLSRIGVPEFLLPGNVAATSAVEDIQLAWSGYEEYDLKSSETENQTAADMSYYYMDPSNQLHYTSASVHRIETKGLVSIIGHYIFKPDTEYYQELLAAR